MLVAVLRHLARPYPKSAMTKTKAALITIAGLVLIVTGLMLVREYWPETSNLNRIAFLIGLGLSAWVLPWTWANLLRKPRGDR